MESDNNHVLRQIQSNLLSFLLKEEDAPMSADTHLNQALFLAMQTLSEDEITKIIKYQMTGNDAIKEFAHPNGNDKISKFLFGKSPEVLAHFVHLLTKINSTSKK